MRTTSRLMRSTGCTSFFAAEKSSSLEGFLAPSKTLSWHYGGLAICYSGQGV